MKNIICKNDDLFFETLIEGFESNDLRKQNDCKVALQAFMGQPKKVMKKKIQAVGVSTDFAQVTADAFNVTIQENNFDLGYEKAFRSVPLGKNQDFWEIYDVVNTLTFYKVEEGQRIEAAGVSGSKAIAYVDYYGGALGWTDKMIRFRKVAAMLGMASIFRNNFFTNKANNHYALLAASVVATGFNTATQGAVADGRLQRNIQTLNQAIFTLTNRCLNKGYGDMANAPVLIYANPFDEARIEAAFRAVTANQASAGATAEQVTKRKVSRIYTYNTSIVAGTPLLVLPGQKIQKADAMAPTTYKNPQDILTLNYVQSVWAIYGAIVGDIDQIQSMTLI